MAQFYPLRTPNEDARQRHVEEALVEMSRVVHTLQSRMDPLDPTGRTPQAQSVIVNTTGSGGGSGGGGTGTINESQVVFDPTGGHRHDGTDSRAIVMAGDVSGTTGVATVDKVKGKPVVAPLVGDDGKVLSYNNGAGNLQWVTLPTTLAGDVTLTPGSLDRNLIQPTDDTYHALVLQDHSPTQTANKQEWRSSTGAVQGFFGPLASPPPGSLGGLLGATTAQFGANLAATFSPTQMSVDAANFTDVQAVIVGTNDNSLNSAAAGLVLIDPVDPSFKSFAANLFYAAYNPAAPTPVLPTVVFGIFGTYDDAGIASYNFGISETTGNGYILKLEGGGLTSATIGRAAFGPSGALTWDGQVSIFCPAATRKGLTIRAKALQSANLVELQNSSAGILLAATALGDLEFRRASSTTQGRSALDQTVTWADNTDATRKARAVFNIWDTAAREAIRIEASGSAAMLGFMGASAIARPSSYTLAGSATRLFPSDPSSAYTGLDNLQPGTPYAKLTDLNTLRGVLSSLEGVVRQLVTDLASTSGYGLLVAA